MVGKSFGRRIKEARKAKRMSQRVLAGKVAIDFGYLSKIERGKVGPPSEKVIMKLAKELDLDKDELLVLANRAPSDLEDVITEAPYIPGILRRARGLTEEDWEEIKWLIEAKKRKRGESAPD